MIRYKLNEYTIRDYYEILYRNRRIYGWTKIVDENGSHELY